MAKKIKYEVWAGGRLIGKRHSLIGNDYTVAIIGDCIVWPEKLAGESHDDHRARGLRDGIWKPYVHSYSRDTATANSRLHEFTRETVRNLAVVPVAEVEQWTKVDPDGYPIKALPEAVEDFLDFLRDFLGGPQWGELTGEVKGCNPLPSLMVLQEALNQDAIKKAKKARPYIDVVQEALADDTDPEDHRFGKREADKIDGFDRDDLGESVDH